MKTKIVNHNGALSLEIGGKVVDSLSMKSFRPTKNNVKDFYDAGVRLFHVYCSGLATAVGLPYSVYGETWFGDKNYCFDNLDRQIEFFKETAPDAYVFINVHLDTRNWYLEENPGAASSFTHLSQIAADEKWRKDTADYLKALIAHVEEKYDDFVCGYFLLGGYTTEWFSEFDFEETHPVKEKAFRKYLHDESASIPTKEQLEKPANQIFLDPEKDALVISYRKFHNELITDTVLYFAAAAQEVLDHKKVVGCFFGYILELSGERLWNAGHLDMDRIYRSPDFDLLATPSSYLFRAYDDTGAYMLLSDTLELNGKMYFNSFDHITYTLPDLPSNPRRLSKDDDALAILKMRKDMLPSRKHAIDAIHREFMLRAAKRTGLWWFDMLEGWFYDDKLMEMIGELVEKSKKLLPIPKKSNSEVAVFVSSESLYYANKCSRINSELIVRQRGALARMGCPYDIYSLNDVDRIDPNAYKLYIFLDAYFLTESQRAFINGKLKANGRTLFFVNACDYIDDTEISKERFEDMLGMRVERLEKDENTINAYDSRYGFTAPKTPTWFVSDAGAEILGRYSISRKCGLARKSFGDHTVYFSGVGNVSHEVLRRIARDCGIHIYTENGVAVYINSALVGVYNTANEFTEVNLGIDGEFEEFFSGKLYRTQNGKVTLPTGENPAQMLIVYKN